AGAVTPHSIAARLMVYATAFMESGTQVLTPVATGLHARQKHTEQQELVLEGGKFCLVLALFFLSSFYALGRPFIELWMGPGFELSWVLLVVLALGELLPMSQWIAYGMILGKSRHKVMALLSIVENVAAIGLAILLVGPYGLPGVCVAAAVPAALCRGV